MISIVIPAFNEAENIPATIGDILASWSPDSESLEIIVVDDHSTDNTFETVAAFQAPNVKALRISRRGGSHTAIRAGLAVARGEAVICVSADGQEPPNVFPEMVRKWKEGGDIVWALRARREKEPFFLRVPAAIFYKVLSRINKTGGDIDLFRADFFLLDRKVVAAVNSCPERHTSLFGLLIWLGFSQDYVEYQRLQRKFGHSKWEFASRLTLALDWIIAFSGTPLRFVTYAGFFVATIGFIYALLTIVNWWAGSPVEGWTSVMVSILMFSGIQLMALGIIGEYLWRNLEESRRRPLFQIEKTTEEK